MKLISVITNTGDICFVNPEAVKLIIPVTDEMSDIILHNNNQLRVKEAAYKVAERLEGRL